MALQSHAQETFFSFLSPSSFAFYAVESDTGYATGGLGADAIYENYIYFHEVELDGAVTSNWNFRIDTVQSTDVRQKGFAKSSVRGHHFFGQLYTNEQDLYGFYCRFNENLSDTLYTLAPIHIGLESSFHMGIELSPDSLLILGTYQTTLFQTEVLILCMDTLGGIYWQNNIAVQGENLYPVDISPTMDGGYLLTAEEFIGLGGSSVDDELHSRIYKLDNLGNVQLMRKPGDHQNYWTQPCGSVVLENQEVLTFWTQERIINNIGIDQLNPIQTIYFARYSSNGTLLDSGDYLANIENESTGLQGFLYYVYQVQILEDGNILLSGDNLREAFIMKVSPSGEYLWHRTYSPVENVPADNGFSQARFYGVYPASDGGFLCAGEFRSSDSPLYPGGIQVSVLAKVDSMGCLDLDSCEPIVDALHEYEQERLRIFPNPIRGGELNIHFPQEVMVERVMIADALGRFEDLKFEIVIGGNLKLHISNLKFPAGLYSLLITTRDGRLFSENVMVE